MRPVEAMNEPTAVPGLDTRTNHHGCPAGTRKIHCGLNLRRAAPVQDSAGRGRGHRTAAAATNHAGRYRPHASGCTHTRAGGEQQILDLHLDVPKALTVGLLEALDWLTAHEAPAAGELAVTTRFTITVWLG